MRQKTLICIKCHTRKPSKGKICDKCRYHIRKSTGEAKQYYLKNRKRILTHCYLYPRGSRKHRKDALFAFGSKCQKCGWNKAEIILHVHHKDCNRKNGKLPNLAILCPTCHFYQHFLENTGVFAFYKNLKN